MGATQTEVSRNPGGAFVADRKRKIPLPGVGMVDAVDVGVAESTEKWSEVKLDDGSIIRVKLAVVGALRVEGHHDPEGNPMYSLKANPVMTVVSSPDHLRKGAIAPKGVQ
jgi:hypothetical protein